MASLPQFQTTGNVQSKDFGLLQNTWASAINPVINNAPNQSIILKNVVLVNGTNVINHLLGRKLQGWKVVRQRAAAQIYDDQDNNQQPQLTLILVVISAVQFSVDLEVF